MYPYFKDKNQNNPQNGIHMQKQSATVQSTPQSDRKLTELVLMAIDDEIRDMNYYEELMGLTKDSGDREILRGIALDETKHKKFLEEIYSVLTGEAPAQSTPEKKELAPTFVENIENSILEEIAGSKFYRELYLAIPSDDIRDMFLEIFTDEQNHASLLNYLYGKNNR